jgi:hypothetical protein
MRGCTNKVVTVSSFSWKLSLTIRSGGLIMGQRVLFAAMLIGAVLLMSSPVFAGMNAHVAEAIAHAEEAVDHGGQGHAGAVVEHAQVALGHAHAAQKEVSNPHLDAGVSELEKAIDHGGQGHAGVATEHAQSAVGHLKEVH